MKKTLPLVLKTGEKHIVNPREIKFVLSFIVLLIVFMLVEIKLVTHFNTLV